MVKYGSKLWFSLDEDLHTGSPLNQWWKAEHTLACKLKKKFVESFWAMYGWHEKSHLQVYAYMNF